MGAKVITVSKTEADFEARANGVLRAAIPWIDVADVKHQLNFSFKLGHKSVPIDGAKSSTRFGRLDILVEANGKRLAILELKRPGNQLTQADVEQGLSYARVLHPRPPIVIVSNGEKTQTFATHDGTELSGAPSEQDFADLVTAALKIAEADTREAIATLMGPGSDVWVKAVRAATELTLEEMTGDWGDNYAPFTFDFHFPRKASSRVRRALRGSRRVFAVEGAPLVGKSHVLRELAIETRQADDMAVLFIEASGTAACGIAEEIARLLGGALGWRISADEARHWLQSLDNGDGPMLVVAIDGLGLEHDAIRRELEALTARSASTRLKFVVEADTSVIDRLWFSESRRRDTVFARRGERVEVEQLDDEEFDRALGVLDKSGVRLMKGAEKSDEYRQPWVLRSMVASVAGSPNVKKGLTAVLAPLLSLNLFEHVRERFVQDPLIEQAATFGRAVLDDYARADRPQDVMLRSMHSFMVRKSIMRHHADSADITAMEKSGLLGSILDEANRAVLTGRFPELIASELSRQLATALDERMRGGKKDADAADWLISTTSRLPLGDVIGAQALIDLAELRDGISVEFLNRLLDSAPSVRNIAPGSRSVAWLKGIGRLDITVRDDGVTVVKAKGSSETIEFREKGQSFADLNAWLILSHLAAMPIGAIAADDESRIVGLVNPAILSLVGTSPIPLRRISEDIERTSLHTHDAPDGSSLVCRNDGIIEPITFSLLRFLEHHMQNADDWLDNACKEGSPALLNRIAQALQQLSELNPDSETASWASARLNTKVGPAFALAMEQS